MPHITPGRGIPRGGVARRLHMADMRAPHALPRGRRAPGLMQGITLPGDWRFAQILSGLQATNSRRHSSQTFTMLSTLLRELRHGLRALSRKPAFSLVVVSTLALAIGASTIIYGIVHGVLLAPLPYPEPDRLVGVWQV